MNKKDLLNFIERVESKAIKSVEEKWNKHIEAKEDEIFSKYKEKLDMYQSTFNNFSTNLTNLLTDMNEDQEVAYSGHYYINDSLRRLARIEEIV